MTPAEQFRMTRLQVFKWGTFDGLHDIRISEKGFLFVGRSGSGKTTLLDAISAILREIAAKGKDARFQKTERGKFAATA